MDEEVIGVCLCVGDVDELVGGLVGGVGDGDYVV